MIREKMFKESILAILFLTCNSALAKSGSLLYSEKNVKIGENEPNTLNSNQSSTSLTSTHYSTFTFNPSGQDYVNSITFTPTGGTSIYDLQSNGTPAHIWQDPSSPNNIHVVYMTSPPGDDPGSNFPGRSTKYFFSSDRGVIWTFITELPGANIRSGFPSITGLSNGVAVIANHFKFGGPNVSRTFVFIDAFPGLGSFTMLDPGLGMTGQVEWPRIVGTSSITQPTKFALISGAKESDSAFFNYSNSYTSSQFGQWNFFRGKNDEGYAIASSQGGKIGIAYVNNDDLYPSDYADLFFIESTDGGITYSSPLKIFDADFTSSNADSLGAFKGVSIVYQDNTPKIVFETVRQGGGQFIPALPSNIRFWSPDLPGVNPNKSMIVADKNNTPFHPYVGVNDQITGICRPTLGKSMDGAVLFLAFNVASPATGGRSDTTSFKDVYLALSGSGGLSWKVPVKITPDNPTRDWSYPSISPVNDKVGSFYYANMVIQSDSVPGSYQNGPANGESLASQVFVRVKMNDGLVGINNTGNYISNSYQLSQNYPNPFNPNTSIQFSIPVTSDVTLRIYDIKGEEVGVLVNNEKFSAGVYEVSYKPGDLASGIYFYSLTAGDFRETKKMIFIK